MANSVSLREINSIPFSFYPNPANGICEVHYTTTSNSKVDISIYDLGGRKVEVIFEANQVPGKYFINYDTSSLPEGTYYMMFRIGNQQNAKKIVVIK